MGIPTSSNEISFPVTDGFSFINLSRSLVDCSAIGILDASSVSFRCMISCVAKFPLSSQILGELLW
jgi:hypothetical protein